MKFSLIDISLGRCALATPIDPLLLSVVRSAKTPENIYTNASVCFKCAFVCVVMNTNKPSCEAQDKCRSKDHNSKHSLSQRTVQYVDIFSFPFCFISFRFAMIQPNFSYVNIGE